MPIFSVDFSVRGDGTIEVEATSPESAEEKAYDKLKAMSDRDLADWVLGFDIVTETPEDPEDDILTFVI